MALDILEVYNEYLHMTYRQKVELARKNIADMGDFLLRVGIKDQDRVSFYLNLVRLFVTADKKASLEECKLFNDIFAINMSYPNFTKLMMGHDEQFLKIMDGFVDKMDEKAKVAACSFGLLFLSVDRNITEEEQAVFKRILD